MYNGSYGKKPIFGLFFSSQNTTYKKLQKMIRNFPKSRRAIKFCALKRVVM